VSVPSISCSWRKASVVNANLWVLNLSSNVHCIHSNQKRRADHKTIVQTGMFRGEHKKSTRKGYQSHLTHLIKKVNTIIDSESWPSKEDIATLTNSTDHFNEHTTLLKEVDQEIANCYNWRWTRSRYCWICCHSRGNWDKISQVRGPLPHQFHLPCWMCLLQNLCHLQPTVTLPATQLIIHPVTTRLSVSDCQSWVYLPSLGPLLHGRVSGTHLR